MFYFLEYFYIYSKDLPKPVPPPVIYAILFLNVSGGSMGVLIGLKNLAFSSKFGCGIPDSDSDCNLFLF